MKLIGTLAHPSVNPQLSLDRISREWNNIRVALRVALEQRQDLDGGRRAVRSLWPFWLATGRTSEAWHWIELALQGDNIPAQLRGELLQRAATIAAGRGDASAPALAKLLVEMHERSNDHASLGGALLLLANTKVAIGSGDEAEPYLRRALGHFRAAGDRRGIAIALCALGTVAGQQHLNHSGAKTLLQHSLEIFREIEDSFGCAEVLGNLSVTAMRAGEYAEALDYGQQSLEVLRRLGNVADTVLAHLNITEIYTEWHKPAKALAALKLARRVLATNANRLYQAYYFEAAFKLAMEFGAHRLAAQLYGYAARQRRNARTPLQPNERDLLQARTTILARTLDEATLRDLVSKGSTRDGATVEGLIDRLESAPK
jgi:tetratricopeptide (TPR) repeat protein